MERKEVVRFLSLFVMGILAAGMIVFQVISGPQVLFSAPLSDASLGSDLGGVETGSGIENEDVSDSTPGNPIDLPSGEPSDPSDPVDDLPSEDDTPAGGDTNPDNSFVPADEKTSNENLDVTESTTSPGEPQNDPAGESSPDELPEEPADNPFAPADETTGDDLTTEDSVTPSGETPEDDITTDEGTAPPDETTDNETIAPPDPLVPGPGGEDDDTPSPGSPGPSGTPSSNTPCLSSWVCTQWGSCTGGTQERECTDRNECPVAGQKPTTSRSCGSGASQPDSRSSSQTLEETEPAPELPQTPESPVIDSPLTTTMKSSYFLLFLLVGIITTIISLKKMHQFEDGDRMKALKQKPSVDSFMDHEIEGVRGRMDSSRGLR